MTRILGGAAFFALLVALDAASGHPRAKPSSTPGVHVPGDNPLDEKIREQEKRVEANPSSADLHNDLGNLLAARGLFDAARQQYEAAIKLDRKQYLAPYNLGLLDETEGKVSQAISAYEKSVDRNRSFPPSRFRLGRLYEKQGKDLAAIQQYAIALRIDPSMREVRRNPLVVDTCLLDQVSLENYPRDLAAVAVKAEAAFVEEERFRHAPVDHPLSSEEVAEPAPVGTATRGPSATAVPVPAAVVPTAVSTAVPVVPTPSAANTPVPEAPVPPAYSPPPILVVPTPVPYRRPMPVPPLPPASGSPGIRG
jgi:tetratricopeptide (TPR) repeat protein